MKTSVKSMPYQSFKISPRVAKILGLIFFFLGLMLPIVWIVWIIFRPNFVPSPEWIKLVNGWSWISSITAAFLVSVIFILLAKVDGEKLFYKNQPNKKKLFNFISVLFWALIVLMSYRDLTISAIPYFLTSSEAKVGVEHAEVDASVMQRMGSGVRLTPVYAYRRLVPFNNSRAIFCIKRRWTVEITGRKGRWGMHLDRAVVRNPRTDDGIDVDYTKKRMSFLGTC